MMSGFTVGNEQSSNSNPTVDPTHVFSHDRFGVPSPISTPHQPIDQLKVESNCSDSQVPLSPSTGIKSSPAIQKTEGDEPDFEETDIALDQLKELETQIIVNKHSRVDGRKTRHSRNKAKNAVKDEPSQNLATTPPPNSGASYKAKQLKNFIKNNKRQKHQNDEILKDSVERNNNNVNIDMKEESTAVLSPIGATTNVLESMKQQFLQGTENVPEDAAVPPKDSKKRRPGRPKKHAITKPLEPSSQNNNPPSSTVPKPPMSPEISPKKEGTSVNLSIDFYARKNPLTKGLRGIRKSESGSDSNSSSPTKENVRISPRSPTLSTLNQHWPQSPLSGTPKENGTPKSPLLSSAAKSLTFQPLSPTKEENPTKVENVATNNTNGVSPSLPNGSSDVGEQITNGGLNGVGSQKRGRGKRKVLGQQTPESSTKKTVSTLVVDVHNTMNGDPQTVIPPKNPIVLKKKKSARSDNAVASLSRSGKENAPNPPSVPESSDASHLPTSPSASKNSDIPPAPSNKSTNMPSAERVPKVQKPEVPLPVVNSALSSPPVNSDKTPSTSKPVKRTANGLPVDKRQRTMLDFTTKLTKSLDENQIAALLPESPKEKAPSPQSAPKVSPSSPKTPSPQKSPESNDNSRNKTKNKSLNAVIEKLQSPNSKDNNGDDETVHTTDVQCKQELIEVKQEPFEETSEVTLVEATAVDTSIEPKKEILDDGEQLPARPDESGAQPVSSSDVSSSQIIPKKKGKRREVENLFMDEGTLNLLTSLQSGSRRSAIAMVDESETPNSQALYAESVKQRMLADRKRKFSGTNAASGVSGKIGPPDAKKPRLDVPTPVSKPDNQSGPSKKKLGRPSNAELKRKRELMGIKTTSTAPKQPDQTKDFSDKSVPPLKIKLHSTTQPKVAPTSGSNQIKSKPTAPSINPQKVLKPGSAGRPSLPGPSGIGLSKKPAQQLLSRKSLPSKLSNTPITSLLKPTNGQQNAAKLKKTTGEGVRHSQRSRSRQADNLQFRDIHLRKFQNVVQIILNPCTTQIKYAFNSRVLRELCEALSLLRRDNSVKLVLFTGMGTTFCNGIDFTCLNHSNPELRNQNALNLTRSIREFLLTLVQYPKVIIAGVNGTATGLGVTMLPLFDMVYATEKAEFFLPYNILGQVPEGGATFTFPYSFGKLRANKLFMGRKMTAMEAENVGLVTETLWNATFMQELIPKVCTAAQQPCTANESTKSLVNHHMHTKLELALESENRLLVQQWTSPEFVQNTKRLLDAHHFAMQRSLSLP